ncbi:hypothetical protein D3C71_2214490 [compost metagenome]
MASRAGGTHFLSRMLSPMFDLCAGEPADVAEQDSDRPTGRFVSEASVTQARERGQALVDRD